MNGCEEKWSKLMKRIEVINCLKKEAQTSEDIDLERSKEMIESEYEERISKDVLEVELFLREVINEAKK
jgi:hypothetical protein